MNLRLPKIEKVHYHRGSQNSSNMDPALIEFQNSLNFALNLKNENFAESFGRNSAGCLSPAILKAFFENFRIVSDNCALLSSRIPHDRDPVQLKINILEFNYYVQDLRKALNETPINFYSVPFKIKSLVATTNSLVEFVSKRASTNI